MNDWNIQALLIVKNFTWKIFQLSKGKKHSNTIVSGCLPQNLPRTSIKAGNCSNYLPFCHQILCYSQFDPTSYSLAKQMESRLPQFELKFVIRTGYGKLFIFSCFSVNVRMSSSLLGCLNIFFEVTLLVYLGQGTQYIPICNVFTYCVGGWSVRLEDLCLPS